MKAALFVAAAAAFTACARADVSGFVELRHTQRSGGGAMVQEELAEVFAEHRLDAQSSISIRAEAVDESVSHTQKVGVREGTIAWQPAPDIDIRIGRQVITWGVSDYLWVNDIFPKHYDVFFTGGSFDRIKEPVDAAHLTLHGRADIEWVVAKPKADRMPSPARFVAVAPAATATAAEDARGKIDLALKASTSWGGWDVAAYAASFNSRESRHFMDRSGLQFDRPRVRHLGVSLTGNAGSGVMWMEAAIRHVDTRRDGVVDRDFLRSSAKFIFGYSREIAQDVTASAQVQLESALSRDPYLRSLAPGVRPVREFNPVMHLRIVGHWANQTIGGGAQVFAGADGDTHFNPFVNWSPADGWTLETGANLFRGRPDSRFGVFRRDSNFYASARYSY